MFLRGPKNRDLIEQVKLGGALVALVAGLAAGLTWIDGRYLQNQLFQEHRDNLAVEFARLETEMVRAMEAVERERQRDLAATRLSIQSATLVSLVLRRDLLISRGQANLSESEQIELDLLQIKIDEILTSPAS